MFDKILNKKFSLLPWITYLEDGPVFEAFKALKGEKEIFETYIPVKLGNHLYYSSLYYLKSLRKEDLSKLVIVDEDGKILKDKEKAYKISLAVNLFVRITPPENLKYIVRNLEEIDKVKEYKSKADYFVPTAKLFLSKKDAETLEKSLESFYQHENTAKQLLARYVQGVEKIKNLKSIDYTEIIDLVDSYTKAGFERVRAKENIMKFIELIRDSKKALPHQEDNYLDTEAGAYYMIDRLEAYVVRDVKLLEIKYENIRQYYSKNVAEDEAKALLDFFNKNI